MNEEGKDAMSMEGNDERVLRAGGDSVIDGARFGLTSEGAGMGGRLAVLAGDSADSAALGILFERVAAAVGSASFGQGGQGPAVVELEAGDAARLLMLARAGAAAGKLEQLSAAVAKLLGSAGVIKPGRGRPVSVATALQDLRAVFWQVSGRANEVARRDAVAAGLVAMAAGSVPADAAEQLGGA